MRSGTYEHKQHLTSLCGLFGDLWLLVLTLNLLSLFLIWFGLLLGIRCLDFFLLLLLLLGLLLGGFLFALDFFLGLKSLKAAIAAGFLNVEVSAIDVTHLQNISC